MENDIPFGNFNRENGTTFIDFPPFLGIFQWDEPTKRVPFTAEPEAVRLMSLTMKNFLCCLSGNAPNFRSKLFNFQLE